MLTTSQRVHTRLRHVRIGDLNRRATRYNDTHNARQLTISLITMIFNLLITVNKGRFLNDLKINRGNVTFRTLNRRDTINIGSTSTLNTRHRTQDATNHHNLHNLASTGRLNKNRLNGTRYYRSTRYRTRNSTFRNGNLRLMRIGSAYSNNFRYTPLSPSY